MADLVDNGGETEQLLRDIEINNCINKVLPQRIGDNCVDCDEPIPSERLNAGGHIVRCIDCQHTYELLKKRGRL